jgi:hypothetical protein
MTRKPTRRGANIVARLSSQNRSGSPKPKRPASGPGNTSTVQTPSPYDEFKAFNAWRAELGLRLLTKDEFRGIYERHQRKRENAQAQGKTVVEALDEAFGVNDTENAGR